jgi:DNA-binding PadR family transcriptional regulator
MKATEFLVLAVLAEGPRHGYALAQAAADRSRQQIQIRAGDLYRVLYRMQNAGLIEATTPPRREGESRRAYYRVTAEGRRAARAEARVLREVCDDLLRPSSPGLGRP